MMTHITEQLGWGMASDDRSDESHSSVTEDESEASDSETTDIETTTMPVPYSYEPNYEPSSSTSSGDSSGDDSAPNRLSDLTW